MLIFTAILLSYFVLNFRQQYLASDKTTRGYFCTSTAETGENFVYLVVLIRQHSKVLKVYKPIVYMAQVPYKSQSNYPYINYHTVQDLNDIVLSQTSSSYSLDFSTQYLNVETSFKFTLSPFELKGISKKSAYTLFKQHAHNAILTINTKKASNCFEVATRQEILNTIREMARSSIEKDVATILHEGDDYICEIKQKVGLFDVMQTIIKVNVKSDSLNQIQYDVVVSKHIGNKLVSNGKSKSYKETINSALTVGINGNSVFNGNVLITEDENKPFVMFIGLNYFIEINGKTTMTASVYDSRMKKAQSGKCVQNKINND